MDAVQGRGQFNAMTATLGDLYVHEILLIISQVVEVAYIQVIELLKHLTHSQVDL